MVDVVRTAARWRCCAHLGLSASALVALLLAGCGAPLAAPARPAAAEGVIVKGTSGFRAPEGASLLMADANLWLVPATGASPELAAGSWRQRDDVVAAYPNSTYRVLDAQGERQRTRAAIGGADVGWNLKQIAAPQAWQCQRHNGVPEQGSGIIVAVLDTGVDPTHPALAPNLLPMADVWAELHPSRPATPPSCQAKDPQPLVADVCVQDGAIMDWTGRDGNGHGTHVAGVIAARAGVGLPLQGVAQQASVLPIKVANHQGLTDVASMIRGIAVALARGARVINVSIGGRPDQAGLQAELSVLQQGVEAAIARGVVFVAANGNEGNHQPLSWPAAYQNVIAVAATTGTGDIASYSNAGPQTTLAAPGGGSLEEGGGIVSTWPTYLTASDFRGEISQPHLTESLVGTSMAAPHVSGAVALLLAQEPGLKPQSVRVRLAATADPLSRNGFSALAGFGQVNARHALKQRHDS